MALEINEITILIGVRDDQKPEPINQPPERANPHKLDMEELIEQVTRRVLQALKNNRER